MLQAKGIRLGEWPPSLRTLVWCGLTRDESASEVRTLRAANESREARIFLEERNAVIGFDDAAGTIVRDEATNANVLNDLIANPGQP